MENKEKYDVLCQIFPNLASQLRGSMGNLYSALQRLLAQSTGDDPERDQSLAMLYQSYYRMMRIIGNLSDAPTLLTEEPLRLSNENIVSFVQEICRQAEPLAELCGQRIIFESDKPYHIMAINAAGIERLVLNLLSNAMKFSGAGAVVTVSIKIKRETVELIVEDTGPGIDAANQDSLFDRYQHPELLDPAPHGFGLGLPLCRRVAQGHGGTILISSVLHAGTKVVVSLPNHRAKHSQLRDMSFDYTGGFSHMLVELSDALPSAAFRARHLDH